MSLTELGWLFTFGVLVHNTEEALFLPAWSAGAGRWHVRVGANQIRFAVVVLLLNLPLGSLFLSRALSENDVEWNTIAWSAPLTALAIVASIPVWFAIGRRVFPGHS